MIVNRFAVNRFAVIGGLVFLLTLMPGRLIQAIDLVRNGQPVATVVIAERKDNARTKRSRKAWNDRRAAEVFVDWVEKITDAKLPIVDEAPTTGTVVYLGAAAVEAGLALDRIDSPSREGVRIESDGRRILVAGQSPTATVKAVCRLLEELGCRYFVDHPIGEVFPRTKNLVVRKLDLTEKPGFLMRRIWGSQWSGSSLWKVWNGAGGIPFQTGHSWGNYVSKDLFQQHPDYFPVYDGTRRVSDWYCTSNPELRRVFTRGVIKQIESGTQNPSISPPDGRGYCQCSTCRGQDDPKSREPSTGTVCVTNRYCDFYRDVARHVAKSRPESILNFYCYADYTQAPTGQLKLPSNLCAWIAPIRYCRFHRIGHQGCSSRSQLKELLDGWSDSVDRIGYRTYNYNLAECCVPFSKIDVWRNDIPYLKSKGCVGINLETLTNWQIYGPHIYLSIRLAYDPTANTDTIMDDYFERFYGPAAAPSMKAYWMGIDRAFADLGCHSGSFFALHRVYTPEFTHVCRKRLNQAADATRGKATYAARVEMASEGLRNAEQYMALRHAMNRGDFQKARRTYEQLVTRSEKHQQTGLGNHYTVGYLKRFVGKSLLACDAMTRSPNRVLAVLPDRWRLAYDDENQGIRLGFHQATFDDSDWIEVATYSDPLDAQGIADRQTVLWYRTTLELSKKPAGDKWLLFFTEVDGDATVYMNGREVGTSEKKRTPFSVDITSVAKVGRNHIAVRIDHSKITELFLGGIIRPTLLVAE